MKILTSIAVVLISFAFGRYSAPEKVRIETKIVEVEKKKEVVVGSKDRNKKKTVTVTEITRPDGTHEKTTVTVEETQTEVKERRKETSGTTTTTDSTNETTYKAAQTHLVVLVGGNVADLTSGPVYGVAVSRNVLGPITLGAFGLTNKSLGVSLGLTF